MKEVVGVDAVRLFTEKLNGRRGRVDDPIVLHQDHPYWVGVAEDADEVGTAMLFLDDSTLEHGCLEVVPGSHRDGEMPRREVADFGPSVVHRSQPNRSARDRRALLYSYQPAGRRQMRDVQGFAGRNRRS